MKLLRRIRSLLRKGKLDAAMTEEMRHHVELQAELNLKAGMNPDEARYAAQRQFGNVASIQEQAREARGWLWLEQGIQDGRYALRGLTRSPGFSAVVVLTLALGIGMNTVVFSFYRTLVGKPLPVRAPEEVLRVTADGRRFQAAFTLDEYDDLRARLLSTEGLLAMSSLQVLLVSDGLGTHERQRPTAVQLVSANYFSLLGIPTTLGRTFADGERTGAVLSYDAWQRRFNGDRSVVGRSVVMQGVLVPILGVAPENFGGTIPPSAPDFWLPMALQPEVLPGADWLHDPAARVWQVMARRKATSSPVQVGAEIEVAARSWRQPDGKPLQPRVQPATFFQLGGAQVHAVCVSLLVAVGLVLLIGCINVVNLLLARNALREHELAVRLALGASRGRLVRQLCTESLLLGLLGGLLGFALAWWSCIGIRAWLTTIMREITRGTWSPFLDLTPDGTVFIYSLSIALIAGVIVGLRPAWRGASVNVDMALKGHSAGQTVASGAFGRRNLLLSVQVAASLLLLAGAGLLLRGARHALTTDPGYDVKHLIAVVAWSNLNSAAAASAEQAARAREIDARLRAVPGVVAVSGADRAPFSGHSIRPYITDEEKWVKDCVALFVDRDYFTTLGLPLVAGRMFTAEETAAGAPLVVITQSAARHLWPDKDPLGRQIRSPKPEAGGRPPVRYTVIGVVRDARFTLLSRTDEADLFFPQAATAMWLVRTQVAPETLVRQLYAVMHDVDPKLLAQAAVMTLEEGPMRVQLLSAQAPASFASLLGVIALALAAVGISGVVSFMVARRTREFGIRLALGAQRRDVVQLVLRQTLRPVAWGVALGLAGAVAISVLLTRLVLNPEMPDLTYGAGAIPVATLGGVLAMLVAVIALAAWLPARRAAKVDPMIALRAE